jgi:hypothetical protein
VLPDAINRVVVVGVGDPQKATEINEHLSRQDRDELDKLSRRLGGQYHDGNLIALPSHLLGDLATPHPVSRVVVWKQREMAILAVVSAAVILALIPVAFEFFGESSNYIQVGDKRI